MLIRELHLTHVGPVRELEIQFSPRTNVLTGDNGLGKTFLLDIVWWAVAGTWSAEPIAPARRPDAPAVIWSQLMNEHGSRFEQRSEWNSKAQRWPHSRRKPLNGLVVYARVDGTFAVWDPLRTSGSSKSPRRVPLVFSADSVWNGLKVGSVPACRGLIEDVTSWQMQGGDAAKQFDSVLRDLSPDGHALQLSSEPGRASLEDVRDIPMLEAPYGPVPLTQASAGIKRIIQFAYLLVWGWREHQRAAELQGIGPERNVLILIDEVEAHLHPRWQRQILPALRRVLNALADDTAVQMIAATHSPLIVSSMDPVFDPEFDRLMTLDLASSGPNRGHPVLADHGWTPRSDAGAWLGSDTFAGVSLRPPEVETALATFRAADRLNDADGARSAYWMLADWVAPDDIDLVRLRAVLQSRGWYEVRFAPARDDPTET